MKGVPEDSILHKADTDYGGDVMAIYKDLYYGAELEFDLLAKKPKFDLRSNMTIVSKTSFIRAINFWSEEKRVIERAKRNQEKRKK
jgi:hypothetical protein